MTDIWVCSTCHSVNRQRKATCYKCGAPQSEATGEGSTHRAEQALQMRAVIPYRSSLVRALVAAAFILAFAVLGVVVLVESVGLAQYLRDEIPALLQSGQLDRARLIDLASGAFVPLLLRGVSGVGGLLFFSAWLSRVIMNVPALGGGTPGTTPTKAFIYPLIPFWNLFKVPPMIQDALYRLDPKSGGFFMILVAWIGLVGSAIIGFVVGWWVDLRLATVLPTSRTLGEAIDVFRGAYDMQFLIDVATTLMVSIGAIILVMVMFRIEARAAARDREIRKAALAPRAEPGTVEARPGGISYEAAALATVGQAAAVPPDPVQERPAIAASGGPIAASEAPPDAADPPSAPDPVARDAPPQLIVTVSSHGRIIAELDGLSEVVQLDDLRAAAAALTRAGGSAVVTTATDTADARWAARDVAAALRDSGVPTIFEA